MSSPLQSLLEVALVGTQRQNATAPEMAGDLGALLNQVATSSATPQHQLLQMAGVMTICSRAGFQAAAPSTPAWPPAPADTATTPDTRMGDLVLRPILLDGPQRLQIQALTRLADCGLRLPPALLPTALEMGRRSVAVRPALTAALGERGRWLAQQNSAWHYAAGVGAQASEQEQWDLGTPEQRLKLFTHMRQTDAATARDKLTAELKELSAAERTALVPLLAVNLSVADELLLDTLLVKDRSKEVRQVAATLLARLTGSRHAQVITAALAPLVKMERGILSKKLVIDAPTAADPAWKDEAIEATRPQHNTQNYGLGERAWWLYQLVRQCPLDWWQQHTGLEPGELIKSSAKSEWQQALARGWAEAAIATQNLPFAQALLQNWSQFAKVADKSEVLAVLPLDQRELFWAQNMPSAKQTLSNFLRDILTACPDGYVLSPPLSQHLALAIAPKMQGFEAANDYELRYVLPEMLCVLDVPALDVISAVPPPADPTPSVAAQSAQLVRIVTARQTLAALKPSKSL
jgi:hypothetical protein